MVLPMRDKMLENVIQRELACYKKENGCTPEDNGYDGEVYVFTAKIITDKSFSEHILHEINFFESYWFYNDNLVLQECLRELRKAIIPKAEAIRIHGRY